MEDEYIRVWFIEDEAELSDEEFQLFKERSVITGRVSDVLPGGGMITTVGDQRLRVRSSSSDGEEFVVEKSVNDDWERIGYVVDAEDVEIVPRES